MVEYGWIFAGMFVLAFLQLVVFIYLHKRQSAFRKNQGAGEPEIRDGQRESVGMSGLRCPSCGAVNDSDFRYCRSCISQL